MRKMKEKRIKKQIRKNYPLEEKLSLRLCVFTWEIPAKIGYAVAPTVHVTCFPEFRPNPVPFTRKLCALPLAMRRHSLLNFSSENDMYFNKLTIAKKAKCVKPKSEKTGKISVELPGEKAQNFPRKKWNRLWTKSTDAVMILTIYFGFKPCCVG